MKDPVKSDHQTDFDNLTKETVEEEIAKLRIIDDDYYSDDDRRDRVRLTGNGIDFKALKAGQDVEFGFDENQDNYNWDDEEDKPIDYEKIFRNRNMDVIDVEDDEDDAGEKENNQKLSSGKTPFEKLRTKMTDITPNKDSGVLKRVIQNGTGLIIPIGSRVRVHYNAYFEMNDEPFDSTYLRSKSFEFKLGASEVVHGLDIAVSTMKKREKSQFIFEPDYFMGKFGCEPRVPRETPVLFEIEVISFVEANAYDQFAQSSEEQRKKLTFTQILQICNCLRELGNDNYARKLYKDASKKYRKSIYLLDNTSVNEEEEEKKWRSVMLKLYLNMSQVCLKQSKPKKCIHFCKQVLEFEPENVKALFRYGQMLEKDIYKRMFTKSIEGSKSDEKSVTAAATAPTELIMSEKVSLEQNREFIIKKIKEFAENNKSTVFNVQMDMYSIEIINFIIRQAEELKLNIRHIKGATNIMQIIKN